MNFEDWRNALYRDAIRDGRWASLRELGEYILRAFWERGVEPTVKALIADSEGASRTM